MAAQILNEFGVTLPILEECMFSICNSKLCFVRSRKEKGFSLSEIFCFYIPASCFLGFDLLDDFFGNHFRVVVVLAVPMPMLPLLNLFRCRHCLG